MLKRCLLVSILAVALGLSVGVHQLHAECSITAHCIVVPAGSVCEETFMC